MTILIVLFFASVIGIIGYCVKNEEIRREAEYLQGYKSATQQLMYNVHASPFKCPQDSFERGWNDAIAKKSNC